MPHRTTQQALESAAAHLRAGRVGDAEAILREIVDTQPDHVDAVQMLAMVLHRSGRSAEAEQRLRRAIETHRSNPNLHNSLAFILASCGRFRVAAEAFGVVVAQRPNIPRAHLNLAQALRSSGQIDEAILIFQRALGLFPADAELRAHAAAAMAEKGHAEQSAGKVEESIAAYGASLVLAPNDAHVLNNLGSALQQSRRRSEAIAAFRQAIAADGSLVAAYFNLGVALSEELQLFEAAGAFGRVVALDPKNAEAFNYLGTTMNGMGRIDEAVAAYRNALSLNPGFAQARSNLAGPLSDAGEVEQALAAAREAEKIEPNPRFASNAMFLLHLHPGYDAAAIYREHRKWTQTYAQPLAARIQPHRNDPDPDRRLRVGYVSPEFTGNPLGRFLLPLFQHHDHRGFEITCFSDVKRPDAGTDRLKSLADRWENTVGWTHEKLAQAVHEAQIDVLVDLSMHTAGNRLLVFARKPAPVQVTYLAYASTTGLETIDHRLTDPFLDPPGGDESCYSEESIRLPHSFWCYLPPDEAPDVGPLPAQSRGQVTFGCLNNFHKVSAPALETWIEILLRVWNSRLILHAFDGSHRRRVSRMLANRDVDPSRLEFVGRRELADYFRAYGRIDIALDPFPYAGGTTTCDALWMGVPVITLSGQTAVGRGGVSILSNVSLPELIAESRDKYVEIATALAKDLPGLADLRHNLRRRMLGSPLMDAAGFARDVESAFRRMWQKWCDQGKSPAIG